MESQPRSNGRHSSHSWFILRQTLGFPGRLPPQPVFIPPASLEERRKQPLLGFQHAKRGCLERARLGHPGFHMHNPGFWSEELPIAVRDRLERGLHFTERGAA